MSARTPNSQDRRKSGRLAIAGDTHCQFGPLVDLSKGGCKIVARKPISLPAGATVNLKLECPGASMLVPAHPVSTRKRKDGLYDISFMFHFTSDKIESQIISFARTARMNVEYSLKPTG